MEIIHILLIMNVILLNHASQSLHIIKKRHVDRACESTPGKFSCDDGYCINGNYKCDGSSDCPDGSDENNIACRCGLSSAPNIRERGRAVEVRKTEHYPWHASIYFFNSSRSEILLCSGALINIRYVLTAASCLYDKDQRIIFPKSSLKVSLGKLMKYFKSEEKTRRIHEVENIVDAKFKLHFFTGNLALIQLKQVVDPSITSPICLLPTDRAPPESKELTFTGWDLHFDKKASHENAGLLQAKLEYLNNAQCKSKFRSSVIAQYLKFDKGCLIPEKGIGVSPNDIGGPVIFKQGNRQYLFGIISNLIPEVHSLIVMTEVAKRIEWINESMTAYSRPKASCESDYFECMGKCIPENRWCDGNYDCPDNSDEINCVTVKKNPPGKTTALACYKKTNALFHPIKCSENCDDEFRAPDSSNFILSCPNGTAFDTDDDQKTIRTFCDNGTWFPDPPTCKRTCNLKKQKSLVMTCEYRGDELNTCEGIIKDRTKVKVQCASGYQQRPFAPNITEFSCLAGEFTRLLPQCIPVCGKLNVDGKYIQPLIIGGNITKQGKFPWYVALYWKKSSTMKEAIFKCGGTLISSNMVLTAAHCVHDESNELDPSWIIVSAAIYSVKLSDKSDVQKIREVIAIHKMPSYGGKVNKYLQDIAIVVLNHDLSFNSFIMPACLNYDGSIKAPKDGDIGYLAGFGYVAEGVDEPSPFLKETNLTYLSYGKCKDKLCQSSFSEYVLPDKFCTTAVEKNPGAPLQGDSGGGLTFAYNGLHYVMGIVSIRSSNFPDISVFTEVSYYIDWIENQLKKA